jgi:hypothetical protein
MNRSDARLDQKSLPLPFRSAAMAPRLASSSTTVVLGRKKSMSVIGLFRQLGNPPALASLYSLDMRPQCTYIRAFPEESALWKGQYSYVAPNSRSTFYRLCRFGVRLLYEVRITEFAHSANTCTPIDSGERGFRITRRHLGR